jgi:hypothetical protein
VLIFLKSFSSASKSVSEISLFAIITNFPFSKYNLAKCLILLFILFLITAFFDIFLDTTADTLRVLEERKKIVKYFE